MIQLQDITKSFGPLPVLRGISLEVARGEVVSIVGPSGAGKTTLLQIMGTLDRPDTGTVVIDGTPVGRMKERELAAFRNRHIGFVFQFHQLLPEFTALENVMIPAFIAGRGTQEAKAAATEMLSLLGLAGRAAHKPNELSGGEKQRVAVARALINRPSVVLADEPSGSLDTRHKEELHRLFFDLRDRLGQTFVIVTHDEGLARMTDRTIRLVDGDGFAHPHGEGVEQGVDEVGLGGAQGGEGEEAAQQQNEENASHGFLVNLSTSFTNASARGRSICTVAKSQ